MRESQGGKNIHAKSTYITIKTTSHPRITLNNATIDDLAQSIKETGLIEPIVVRPKEKGKPYEIITGARRFTAYHKLRKKKTTARILKVDGDEAITMCLFENIQRKDLNPVERAIGLRDIVTRAQKTGRMGKIKAREYIADKIGKSKRSMEFHLDLPKLPEPIQDLVASGSLGWRAATELASLKAPNEKRAVKDMREILSEYWDEKRKKYSISAMRDRPRIKKAVQSKNEFYKARKEKREERFRRQREKYEEASRDVIAEKEEVWGESRRLFLLSCESPPFPLVK